MHYSPRVHCLLVAIVSFREFLAIDHVLDGGGSTEREDLGGQSDPELISIPILFNDFLVLRLQVVQSSLE